MSDVSGIPVPGRPPGHQHGCGAWPAAAGQCSKQCVHGLPTPRAGSEFEDNLRARGAGFKSSGTSDHVPGLGSQTLAQPGNDMSTAELLSAAELLSEMLMALRVQAVHFRHENERLAVHFRNENERRRAQYKDIAQRLEDIAQERENELLCVQAVHSLVAQERPCAQNKNNAQYLEQENELLCVQAVHSLVAQEQPCAQDKDNAQYLEQENDGGAGGREMDTTAAVKIFAVVHQDRYTSKPTGSTLNEPELRAFTPDPRPHAFGTKNVNLTVYSRAMVKVGPLARIRIDDEVYIRILLAAAFGSSFLYAGQTKGVTL